MGEGRAADPISPRGSGRPRERIGDPVGRGRGVIGRTGASFKGGARRAAAGKGGSLETGRARPKWGEKSFKTRGIAAKAEPN